MSDHFQDIYNNKAAQYERLIEREDRAKNISPMLTSIKPHKNLTVVELGAGTGRLTRIMVPEAKLLVAFDQSAHMLSVASEKLHKKFNWALGVADNQQLPIKSGAADLVVAGWSLGHNTGWHPDDWKERIKTTVDEMERITADGGTTMIFETLGTGYVRPHIPTPALEAYYTYLQEERGYIRTWIRTDFEFETVEEAEELLGFFFGDDLLKRFENKEELRLLPECTGIWWKHKPAPDQAEQTEPKKD